MADRLNDSLKHVDVFADGDEEGERGANIECAGEDSAPSHRTGKGARRIFDFVAHNGSEFEAHQAKADHAEGIDNKARVGRNLEICDGDRSTKA